MYLDTLTLSLLALPCARPNLLRISRFNNRQRELTTRLVEIIQLRTSPIINNIYIPNLLVVAVYCNFIVRNNFLLLCFGLVFGRVVPFAVTEIIVTEFIQLYPRQIYVVYNNYNRRIRVGNVSYCIVIEYRTSVKYN